VADTDGDEARERARAAIARVCECLASGEPPDTEADRELAALAARIDSQWWGQHRAETSAR